VLSVCYLLTIGAMARNFIRIKLQNDFEEELKKYREYDISTDPIQPGNEQVDLNGQYVVLLNSRAIQDNKTPYFVHTQTYGNILDTTRMFRVSNLPLTIRLDWIARQCSPLTKQGKTDPLS
jgi:hypothetical protein